MPHRHTLRLELMSSLAQLRQREAERRGGDGVFVQSDAQSTVGEHAVAIRPGITGAEVAESEPLVELRRSGDIGSGQRQFQETAKHRC